MIPIPHHLPIEKALLRENARWNLSFKMCNVLSSHKLLIKKKSLTPYRPR